MEDQAPAPEAPPHPSAMELAIDRLMKAPEAKGEGGFRMLALPRDNVEALIQRDFDVRCYHVAMMDVGAALSDLAHLCNSNPGRADHRAKLGGIAVALRRAAHRVEHGSLEGFMEGVRTEPLAKPKTNG